MGDDVLNDEFVDHETKLWVWLHYGTSSRAVYTMFEVTLSGCWPNYIRPLLDTAGWGYACFFALYVVFVVFAVTRIITAIFLKETMDACNSDKEMMITERADKKKAYLNKLSEVFV